MYKKYGMKIEQLNHTIVLQSDTSVQLCKIDFKDSMTAQKWYNAVCATLNAPLKKSCYTKLYSDHIETGNGYIFEGTDIFIEKNNRHWNMASAKTGIAVDYMLYPTRKQAIFEGITRLLTAVSNTSSLFLPGKKGVQLNPNNTFLWDIYTRKKEYIKKWITKHNLNFDRVCQLPIVSKFNPLLELPGKQNYSELQEYIVSLEQLCIYLENNIICVTTECSND